VIHRRHFFLNWPNTIRAVIMNHYESFFPEPDRFTPLFRSYFNCLEKSKKKEEWTLSVWSALYWFVLYLINAGFLRTQKNHLCPHLFFVGNTMHDARHPHAPVLTQHIRSDARYKKTIRNDTNQVAPTRTIPDNFSTPHAVCRRIKVRR